MPEQDAPARNRDPLRVAHQTADLASHDQTAGLGLQQLGHAHADAHAGFKVEVVEEEAEVDDVHFAVEALEQEIALVEDVGGEEGALEALAVAEELVAELHEFAVEVGAVDVGARGAVGDELADILGEAAAEVEEGLVGVAQAGDEGRIVRGEVDGEVEEEELANAGVGVDVPGFFALLGRGKGVSG